MILIADSGSTKTDWRGIASNQEVSSFQTIGFNPYHIAQESILKELTNSKLNSVKNDVTQVFFYGAGCSSIEKVSEIKLALQHFFINAKVEVNHDLLAAARASCGHEMGMVAILGTGSNTCLFDGKNIVRNVSSLGYILGDEGSGSNIGKAFINALFTDELPKEIMESYSKQFGFELTDVLDAVYKKPLPNKFLAQFVPFVFQHKNTPEIALLIEKCFVAFFGKHICKYQNFEQYPLNIVGSVGFIFKEEIEKVALNYNVKLGKVIKQPIEELVRFHTTV